MLSPVARFLLFLRLNNTPLYIYLTFYSSVHLLTFVVVQTLSHVRLFATPWTAAHQASLSFTISRTLLKLMSIELVMSSPFPPAFNLSPHQDLSNELALCIRWPRYWSFSFSISISPSNEYSVLISFKID